MLPNQVVSQAKPAPIIFNTCYVDPTCQLEKPDQYGTITRSYYSTDRELKNIDLYDQAAPRLRAGEEQHMPPRLSQ